MKVNIDTKKENITLNLTHVISCSLIKSAADKSSKTKFRHSFTIDVGFKEYIFTSTDKQSLLKFKTKFDNLFVNRHRDGRGIVVEL